jgi:hypothetical protein
MSVSYSTYVIFGLALPESALVISTPNPLFGVHKFDPATGDRVVKNIETNIDLYEIANKNKLDCVHRPDAEEFVIGKILVESDLNDRSEPQVIVDLTVEKKLKLANKIQAICEKNKIPFFTEDCATHLANCCSSRGCGSARSRSL